MTDQKSLKFVYKPEVLDKVGLSYPTIWQRMRDGTFPAARDIGGKTAWLESEIDDWMMRRPLRKYKPRGDAQRVKA
jgi:predicted DNA-binding transcriptional regulator AlpA